MNRPEAAGCAENLVAPRRPLWTALAVVAIVAAGVAVYANSFNGPFILDDVHAVQNNPAIRKLRTFWALVPPERVSMARRPLANLTFAINYAIGRLDVRSYHAGNLLIHLLAALTLFGIVRRTLISPSLRDRFGAAAAGLATAVALIWAVHPLQTESVTYIVQRHESLMGLCYLLTLYGVIRGASSETPWRWYAAAIAVCALGMGAKEVMVTAPIVVLLYDRAFLAGLPAGGVGSFREAFRRRAFLYLGLAATWAVLGALLVIYSNADDGGPGLKRTTPWLYLCTQPGVVLHYLSLSFWPRPLCLDYSWPYATSFRQVAPAALAVAALLAAIAWAFVRRPALGFLGAGFFLVLAPTSSIMPLEACFEHRMYLPLAAVLAVAVIAVWRYGGWLLRRLAVSQAGRNAAAIALALTAAVELGGLTFLRNRDYRTAERVWQVAVEQRPKNARALTGLGATYFGMGDDAQAMRCFNAAIGWKPEFADAWYNRAMAFVKAGDSAGAIRDFSEFLSLKPRHPDAWLAHFNRGGAYFNTRRYDEAIQDFSRAIELKPDLALAYVNRANALIQARRPAEAIEDYGAAIKLRPGDAGAYFSRANAGLALRRYDLALADCASAIALKPGYAAAYNTRAIACFSLKDYDKAWSDVAAFRKLGGRPNPGFLKALQQASGRAE